MAEPDAPKTKSVKKSSDSPAPKRGWDEDRVDAKKPDPEAPEGDDAEREERKPAAKSSDDNK